MSPRLVRAEEALETPPCPLPVPAMGHSGWLPAGATLVVRENREAGPHFVITLEDGATLATAVVFGPGAGLGWVAICAGAWALLRDSEAYEATKESR
jgi:hypothetical protein